MKNTKRISINKEETEELLNDAKTLDDISTILHNDGRFQTTASIISYIAGDIRRVLMQEPTIQEE